MEGLVKSVLKDVEGQPKSKPLGDAWLVIGASDAPLSRPGDSGAFCLDPWGNWVGLVFAGSRWLERSYLIAAEDVIEDIQLVTGWNYLGIEV